jgi:NADPH:quinone reductase-like Zn-dependent oxidoreductase
MKYKNVILTKRGGSEVLKIAESEHHIPTTNQVKIKILACGIGRTDIAMRYGYYPFAPKIPFVPGYEIAGKIESVGSGVKEFVEGDIVAALTVYGGYSEYIYLDQQHLVKVPEGLDLAAVAALILNYTTAYQILKRVSKVKADDRVLINGASGGVGTALLDLGKLEGLKMYGTASANKHDIIKKYGAIPIDYNSENYIDFICKREPDGLDYVFDGVGKSHIRKSFRILGKRGKLVEFGYPDFRSMLCGLMMIKILNILPNKRKAAVYGISGSYKKKRLIILKDLQNLLTLLEENKIKPIISKLMPLLEASEANHILESGTVSGKIVLVAPELLE